MRRAQKTMRAIERLEKRRDSINKRLDGVEKFDEVRHKGLKAVVDLVQERYGETITDEELIERVKEELDKKIDRSGVWEAVSDFGINVFVDVAVYYVRNRGKILARRLARVEKRLERKQAQLREQVEPTAQAGGDDGSVSFGIDEGEGDASQAPAAAGGVFSGGSVTPGPGSDWGVVPMMMMRIERLERAVARMQAEAEDDDLDDLDLDDDES